MTNVTCLETAYCQHSAAFYEDIEGTQEVSAAGLFFSNEYSVVKNFESTIDV